MTHRGGGDTQPLRGSSEAPLFRGNEKRLQHLSAAERNVGQGPILPHTVGNLLLT
jgi:hypothetical protein